METPKSDLTNERVDEVITHRTKILDISEHLKHTRDGTLLLKGGKH